MRILIFILALMSAFFVSAGVLDEQRGPDMSDLKPPQGDTQYCTYASVTTNYSGSPKGCGGTEFEAKKQACDLYALTYVYGDSGSYTWGQAICEIDSSTFRLRIPGTRHYSNGQNLPTTAYVSLYAKNYTNETIYKCPNPTYPEYDRQVESSQHSSGIMCAKTKEPEDCPAGYHSKGASAALGSDTCVPKECPPTGSSESLFSSPRIGGSGFDGGGLYCNGGCTYTVDPSQISLGQYAIGVSQGAACGDKPYDDKKLADDADNNNCSFTSDNTVKVLQCPDNHQPEPEENPIDNDASKVDDTETPEKPKNVCAEGDANCHIKNVETEIENSANRQIDNDNELHNKKIEADEKNAKAFLNVMESIDTAILYQTSQDDKLHAVTVGKFNQLVDAVNGIQTGGGGGGGNGTGTGTGNIGGQDCEGTIEECAGIGSGDGVEIPQETRNLEQYAQKYNNWLPDAELPPEKCITLTNGKSLCFSFQYFILFFQAISGLIVISSLIHSASIIVRSV